MENKLENQKSETITELAHRHQNNETHTTTDEELRNARVELSNTDNKEIDGFSRENKSTTPATLARADRESEPEQNEEDDEPENRVPNPYNILE